MRDKYEFYKLKYDKYVLLIKSGNFYITLEKDAIVMHNIFDYKLNNKSNIIKVGFPITSLNKITSKLDNIEVNYLIIDNNIVFKNKFNKNNYNKYLENNTNDILKRIDVINNTLKNNASYSNINDILKDVEYILCKIN